MPVTLWLLPVLPVEIVDAVLTFSARLGRCNIPLTGPPTIEDGMDRPPLGTSRLGIPPTSLSTELIFDASEDMK